jgi:hypothetical protein
VNIENLKTFGIGLVISIVLVLVLWGVFAAEEHDAQQWRDYAASHHCEAKGKREGQWAPVAGGKGGMTYSGDQTVYVCDGGEIVIR